MAESAYAVEEPDIFNTLSNGIEESERQDMLRRMGKNGAGGADASMFSRKMSYDEKHEIMRRYHKLSFVTRFFMWLHSFMTGTEIEVLMNEHDVRKLAREVESQSPGLILYRKKILCESFYRELVQLKAAADFFRPYAEKFDRNPESAYMFIGNLLVPEAGEKIMRELDAALLAADKDVLPDAQKKMMDAMLGTLATIPAEKQLEMASFVRSVVWINQLTKLSLGDFLTLFGKPGSAGHECLFSLVRKDVARLAAVICASVPLEDRVVEVFEYLHGKASLKEESDFSVEALEHIPTLRHFAKSVPMEKIAKVVHGDAMYKVQELKQDEGWFDVYTQEWKRIFEHKLSQWRLGQKRGQLKVMLKEHFKQNDFPLLPSRPWQQIWDGIPFRYDLSMGLISFFMDKYYAQYIKILKILLLEGDFALRDNRQELNSAVDDLTRMHEQLNMLRGQLAAGGEYSVGILRFKDKPKGSSQVAASQVNKVMGFIERDAREIEKLADTACCHLMSLLPGFLSDKIIGRYCTISNLHQLHNEEFDIVGILTDCNSRFLRLYEILKDLELMEKESAKDQGAKP